MISASLAPFPRATVGKSALRNTIAKGMRANLFIAVPPVGCPCWYTLVVVQVPTQRDFEDETSEADYWAE
jgi:hypothetical protein